MSYTLENKKKQIVWLDAVRLVAMFMVVCCHATDPFNFYPGTPPAHIEEIKFWGATYGALLRPCVPLFVMITGALLLPVKTNDTAAFYSKRILRVLWPFLIWSVLFALFPWILGLLGCAPEVLLDFFPFSGEEAMRQSFDVSFNYIAHIPLNFSAIGVHMWYIYLLIGLYLYLPIFSAWVEKASEKAKLYFLLAWGITLFIPYYRAFADPYIWGACSWNEFHMLHYFAGFNGYLLLGHYLRHHEWSVRKTVLWAIPLFLIGTYVTFRGFRYITSLTDYTPEQLELFFYYCSPNVAIMTISLFKLIQKIHISNPAVCRLLSHLTLCGFGIYMMHYFFTGPSILLVRHIGLPVCIQIPCGALLAFGVSWVIVGVIHKALGKKARYLVG